PLGSGALAHPLEEPGGRDPDARAALDGLDEDRADRIAVGRTLFKRRLQRLERGVHPHLALAQRIGIRDAGDARVETLPERLAEAPLAGGERPRAETVVAALEGRDPG